MIKKLFTLFAVSIIAFAVCSCQSNSGKVKTNSKTSGVAEVLNRKSAPESESSASGKKKTSANASDKEPDVDLTKLNSTMIYSEVYNMVSEPEKYIGKLIRMKGIADVYKDEKTKKTYYSCIVKDATACCANGLEFELTDKNDYPKKDDEITVLGTFNTYKEDKVTYCVVKNAVIE